MAEDARSHISEDGSRRRTDPITASPPGIYDSEKHLSQQQIVELKKRLKENPWRAYAVCGYIAVTLYDQRGRLPKHRVLPSREPGSDFADSHGELNSVRQTAFHVAALAANWMQSLDEALVLPGAEWPKNISPPATFAEALQELEALRNPDA